MHEAHCSPSHDLDPIVTTIVVRLELCPDDDPLETLRGMPDHLSEVLEAVEGLHTGSMTIDIGSVVATGETNQFGGWGWITRTELVDEERADEPEETK